MKFKMAENSLFAILLRSPWWVSASVALVLAAAARALVPEPYTVFGMLGAFPIVVISWIAAWRQLRAPSAASLELVLDRAAAMSWKEFSVALQTAYTRDGYTVTELAGAAAKGADIELGKAGRTLLVSAKRWKAATQGIEPLRELDAAVQAREANQGVFIALGTLSDSARSFATEHGIRVLQGKELALLLR